MLLGGGGVNARRLPVHGATRPEAGDREMPCGALFRARERPAWMVLWIANAVPIPGEKAPSRSAPILWISGAVLLALAMLVLLVWEGGAERRELTKLPPAE